SVENPSRLDGSSAARAGEASRMDAIRTAARLRRTGPPGSGAWKMHPFPTGFPAQRQLEIARRSLVLAASPGWIYGGGAGGRLVGAGFQPRTTTSKSSAGTLWKAGLRMSLFQWESMVP